MTKTKRWYTAITVGVLVAAGIAAGAAHRLRHRLHRDTDADRYRCPRCNDTMHPRFARFHEKVCAVFPPSERPTDATS